MTFRLSALTSMLFAPALQDMTHQGRLRKLVFKHLSNTSCTYIRLPAMLYARHEGGMLPKHGYSTQCIRRCAKNRPLITEACGNLHTNEQFSKHMLVNKIIETVHPCTLLTAYAVPHATYIDLSQH